MYDKIIIGAGLYGLYSALRCGEAGQRILVLECDSEPFTRPVYIWATTTRAVTRQR